MATLIVAAWVTSQPVFDEPLVVQPDAFDILPPAEALTLARDASGRVLLVREADPETMRGVDLSAHTGAALRDAVDAVRALGWEGLQAAASSDAEITVPLATLIVPVDAGGQHIAAGTNFRAHAQEVGLDGEPFLFPKVSKPSSWNAEVVRRGRLDFEVELCAVGLTALEPRQPSQLGFLLCNDFTDRWTLLAEIDLDEPMGRTGFADAKGGSTMLPVGLFLVVPADVSVFHERVQLSLGVNGRLLQRASAELMVWTPHRVAQQALEACEERFASVEGNLQIADCERIPSRTLLLTGTPEGVLFHFLNIWSPWSYLRGGDEVVSYGSHLGMLRNVVVDSG